jgi:acetyl esterase/lipase
MNDPTGASHEVEVIRDIEYGTAWVDYQEGHGPMRARPLALDAYRPVGAPGFLPALVLAFGGAFHRGSKEDDVRPEDGPKNTSIADYCERFARRGYACFSIDYRLTQEDPHPGHTPTLGDEPVPTSRIDVVREILGLPPATSIGGFSAGARMAVTAALAEAISPIAVVALSGVVAPGIIDSFHAGSRRRPPIFAAYGEQDLDYVVSGAATMIARLTAADHPHESAFLPGQTHFYPASTRPECSVGAPASLEEAIVGFLDRYVRG